jgi:pyridoxamine 5'-phosphate oxidase
MDKKEIIEFISKNPTCHMATLEDGKPRVRGIGIYRADEDGIVIQVSEPKDIYKQLVKNPETELCFSNAKEGIQIRVRGRVELVEDAELKKEVVEKRQFLKPMVDRYGWGVIKLYCLKHGLAHVWTLKVNLEPKTFVQL